MHERLVDEAADSRHVVGVEPLVRADRFGRVERAAAREHREPREDAPLVVVEQVVAPVDDARAASAGAGAPCGAAGEQAEAVVEAGGDLARASSARTRAAASSMASGSPSRRRRRCSATLGRVVRRVEAAPDRRGRAFDEQAHGLGAAASGGHRRRSPRRRRRAARGSWPARASRGHASSSVVDQLGAPRR